jgi:secreted Zn-dependent insulinase-like peptidase
LNLCANPAHPMSRFTWGNRKSLQLQPLADGVDVRAELLSFFRRHYIPSRMHVVVRGPQSLDELQSFCQDTFGRIPAQPAAVSQPKPSFLLCGPPVSDKTVSLLAALSA